MVKMAYELVSKTDSLDFSFFVPEAFPRKQVIDWIVDYHDAYIEQDVGETERIISLGLFSRQCRRLYGAGRIGRLVNGNIMSPTLGFNRSEFLHDLFEKHDGDFDLMLDDPEYDEVFYMDIRDDDEELLFAKDIEQVFDALHIFYVYSESSWQALDVIRPYPLEIGFQNISRYRTDVHPHFLWPHFFRNMPIVKVW